MKNLRVTRVKIMNVRGASREVYVGSEKQISKPRGEEPARIVSVKRAHKPIQFPGLTLVGAQRRTQGTYVREPELSTWSAWGRRL
eukprot:4876657-Pleurochrysis_carterae.AAC.1